MRFFERGPWCDRCGQKQATSWLDRLCATCGPEVEMEVERDLADVWDEGFQAGMWAEQGYPEDNPYRDPKEGA